MAKIIVEKDKNGKDQIYWVDSEGVKFPQRTVKKEDIRKDALVNKLCKRAKQLQDHVKAAKAAIEAELIKYLEDTAKHNGETWVGGAVIHDFSAEHCVQIKIAKRWTFGPELQIAKQKIDKCIQKWSTGANDKIIALVNRAFKVDKKGEVDADQILGLRQYNFQDKEWLEAMQLISDAQQLVFTKTYYYFQEADENGQLQTIVLDFSNL